MEKVLEKSGNFVSPEKWERWYFDVHYERFPVVNPYFKKLLFKYLPDELKWLLNGEFKNLFIH